MSSPWHIFQKRELTSNILFRGGNKSEFWPILRKNVASKTASKQALNVLLLAVLLVAFYVLNFIIINYHIFQR